MARAGVDGYPEPLHAWATGESPQSRPRLRSVRVDRWEGDRIPAGRDWSFEIGMQSLPYQAAEPTDHAVLLDTRTHEIRG
jgi:hypothetical protein